MTSNGRVGRPGPADDTNSDLGPQYLGAPRDESAPGPEPGVEGAAADDGRLDRARTAGPEGVSARLPKSTRDSVRMPAGRDGLDAATRRRNSGSPKLGVSWQS